MQKELLAIVYSIIKLRIYLIGAKFKIITDHKALTFLNKIVYLNARIIRWSILLQQYDFEVSYCKGKDNVVADFFSRNPRGRFESVSPTSLSVDVLQVEEFHENEVVDCNFIEYDEELRDSLKNLADLQKQDATIQRIIFRVNENPDLDCYVIKENVLFPKR